MAISPPCEEMKLGNTYVAYVLNYFAPLNLKIVVH